VSLALILATLLAQPVATGLGDLDSNRVPDSWFVRSAATLRFEVRADGSVRFNTSAGSAGQCLLSNGSSSPPSWGSCAGGAGGYTGISDEGTGLTSRATLNFIGTGVTCVDNGGATRTDCTIPGGAGAAYATCQEEGTPLTQRATLNFIGSALTAADNGGSSRTDVTLSQSPASASVVGTGRTLTAGNGLTGGGDLTADRTFDIAVTAPVTITGDSVALDQTAALGNVARTTVRRNTGADVGSRRRLNLIEGSNITITVADDAPNEELDVTIAAAGGGGGGAGTTTVDFGAFPGVPLVSTTITGQTGILVGSVVQAWIYPDATAQHTRDEHLIVPLRVHAHSIVAGTGFTISAYFDPESVALDAVANPQNPKTPKPRYNIKQ
jgi:trimeric autotransporter adhesin